MTDCLTPQVEPPVGMTVPTSSPVHLPWPGLREVIYSDVVLWVGTSGEVICPLTLAVLLVNREKAFPAETTKKLP